MVLWFLIGFFWIFEGFYGLGFLAFRVFRV